MNESVAGYESLDKPALVDRIIDLEHEVAKLRNHILNANKKTFGSKSERLSTEQVKFSFNTPAVEEQQSLEQEVVVEKHTRVVHKGRKPLPGDLPREEIHYEAEATKCPCCSASLVTIGEEVSEELEKIPAQLKVIRHIRVKKACPACKGAGVLVPPLPATVFPLERCRPGAGLLADIVVSKYVDHLPLHRQEQMYARLGIELRRQRMCDWVAGIAELLMPLYMALKKEVLALPYIHADETTLKVQDGAEAGKCHTGYLWGLLGPPNLVWFHYDESRAGSVPEEILKDFTGAVHTDAYAGYNTIYLPDKCVRVACLAHIRRAFIEVQKIASKDVGKILTLIAQLYKIEGNLKSPQDRLAVRQLRSKKIVGELFQFLRAVKERTLPKNELMKALNYALNQEAEVLRIFECGEYDLDNNAIERQMRPIAIGRKNYMFAGSHNGARNAAVLYSLLNSCKLNKINSWEWLRDILIRISSDSAVNAQELLPHRWKLKK